MAAAAVLDPFAKFDPGQPRDERGRWTEVAGTGEHEHELDEGPRMYGTPQMPSGSEHGIGVVANPNDHRTPEQKHEDAWKNREHPPRDPHAAAIAANYRASMGLPEPNFGDRDLTEIPADLGRARRVASMALLDLSRRTKKGGLVPIETRVAYNDLIRQVGMQLHAMKEAGIHVEYLTKQDIIDRGLDPEGANPYATATDQRNDVVRNHRLMIASLVDYPASYHPILDSSQGGTYDQFRAVHDYFGHVASGAGFDRHGEFQAWLHHTSMFTGEGRRAASSELHIENSFLVSTGQSAPHFAYLLPNDMVDPFTEDGTYKGAEWVDRGDV